MQNRLVLTGIPSSVPSLPNAADALRDLVEEHGCWVDRFAFLDDHDGEGEDGAGTGTYAAVELHIENVRDRAVDALDGLTIVLDNEGNMIVNENNGEHGAVEDDDGHTTSESESEQLVSFTIHASSATLSQARRLIELCPLDDDDEVAKDRMSIQSLKLPNGLELAVRRSEESGGTGTDPWRGGLILARHICMWLDKEYIVSCKEDSEDSMGLSSRILFHNKDVMELGAGSAGLPSMALAATCRSRGSAEDVSLRSLVTSDGVDEIVSALQRNVTANHLDDSICVKHIDWNHLPATASGQDGNSVLADTIIFADCVYNEEGAMALCSTIRALLTPGGHVVGVLPDFRVGLDSFEKSMEKSGFRPRVIPRIEEESVMGVDSTHQSVVDNAFVCSGGGGKHYRIMWWRDCRISL